MSVRDTIAKLLNMTVKNGCTEDEQEVALRKAAGLAARAGIDLDACRPAGEKKPSVKAKHMSQELKPHQALCAEAAGILYGVECRIYNLGAQGVLFVGREDLIEVAEDTMMWLMRQVEWLYKNSLPKGLSKTARAEYRKTFKAACALRVRQRANETILAMMRNDQAAQEATGKNALVVLGHFEGLRKEIDAYWEEQMRPYAEAAERQRKREEELKERDPKAYERMMKAKEKNRPRMTRGRSIPMGSGTNAGFEAGNRVQLNKQVG